jgi:hypothetical protein
VVSRKIKLSESAPRTSLEETLIFLLYDVKGERANTRTEMTLLAHAVLGSNISKENVSRVKSAYESMLIEVDIDKPGRYSQELVRLAKAGMRSLDEQILIFEEAETPESEDADSSQARARTSKNGVANDDPVAEADGNGADHQHVHVGEAGIGRTEGSGEPASPEEEVHARTE